MEDEILKIITKNDIDHKNLLKITNLNEEELNNIIDILLDKRLIFINEKNKYSSINKEYIIDTLKKCSKGFSYIKDNNDKIIIEPENLHTALKNDLVVVERISNKYGKVIGIIKRKNYKLVCELKEYKNKLVLVPFNGNKEISISCDKSLIKDLVVGDRVYIELENKTDEYNDIIAKKIFKIGNTKDEMCDEIAIAISKGFDIDFSKKAIEELKSIPKEIRKEDLENRLDLRNEKIFTIDGITTKDMDDAVSIKLLDNGNYLIGVHIADVAHYVKFGSELFKESLSRGTSVYLGYKVIPMLPKELSNGICSLNENEDRLTKSTIIEYDPKKGKIVNYKITDSIINSKKRMSYEDLNEYFKTRKINEDYIPLLNEIKLLREFAQTAIKFRKRRGNLEFESNELKIKTDLYDENNIIGFEKRHIGEAESIIEILMILANQVVAVEFEKQNLPFIYRIHNNPDEIKLDSTIEIIKKLGYKLVRIQNAYGQKAIQNILDDYKGTQEYTIISNLLLRSMAKAKYSTNNEGHFGLALDNYCHSTSPIRRFPDLIVQTLINIFINNDYSTNNHWNLLINQLDEISEHSSYKERQADDAEKDYLKLKMAKYMEKHKDEEFEGMLLDVDKDNVYIKLDNNIKGVLDLSSDFARAFDIDTQNKILQCNYSKNKINLGTRLKLKVTKINIPQKEIYFEIKEIIKNQTNNNIKKKELIKKND